MRPARTPGKEAGGASPLRRAARWAVRLVLTVGVTWILFRQVDVSLERLGRLPETWSASDPLQLVASGAVLLAGFLLSVRNWTGIVEELGGRAMRLFEASEVFFTANLGRYVPGKVWQVAGLAYLSRARGVSALASTAGAVLGQGFTLCAAAALGAGAFAGRPGTTLRSGLWPVVAVLGALAVLLLPPVFRRVIPLVFRLAGENPDALPELRSSFGVRWLGAYAGMWVVYGVAFWLLARSFGLSGGLLELTSVFAAAYAAGYLAVFAPAGLGVREGVLTALLVPVTGAGPALALSITARIWMTVVELVPAVPLAVRQIRYGLPGGPGAGPPDREEEGTGGA